MPEIKKTASTKEYDDAVQMLEEGIPVKRVKNSKVDCPSLLKIEGAALLRYPATTSLLQRMKFRCQPTEKLVDVASLIEIRQGYNTDGLHQAAKHFKFQERAPVSL